MEIYQGLGNIDSSFKVVTLGNFDGVHKGHEKLINKAVLLGRQKGLPCYVLSFYPHPKCFFKEDIKYINSLEEKSEKICKLGADALVVMEFNKEIADLSKDYFVEEILYKKMKAKVIVVGFDFLFGKNREGNVETLKQTASLYDMEVYVLPQVEVGGEIVSSSLIRKFMEAGQIKKAESFLGYSPKIVGRVIKGKQIGRTIGFPTANVSYNKEQLIPGNGVYAVQVCVKGIVYSGIANIGIKPTVKSDDLVEIEVHIIDFSEEIYGDEITVCFIEKIRDEKKFSSLEDLKKQIDKDIKKAIKKNIAY